MESLGTRSKRPIEDVDENGHTKKQTIEISNDDVYLENINNKLLDFDLEKVCSITLATINVYCCLKCGKFFQGKSTSSPAYNHAIDNIEHKLFINLDTLKVFLLPDNKELKIDPQSSSSIAILINDIRNLIDPQYDIPSIQDHLYNKNKSFSFCLNHLQYRVGFIGLSRVNNNSRNNFQNVVLLLVSHLYIIRDWYLLQTSKNSPSSEKAILNHQSLKFQKNYELNLKFGLFIRKYWYHKLFKNHLSPYDLLNYINKISNGIFLDDTLDNNDPKFFLNWILNNMNLGFSNRKSNVLTSNIQGEIKIDEIDETQADKIIKSSVSKFWQLTLELPDKKILSTKNVSLIEQISLNKLLHAKFNTPRALSDTISKTYTLLSLPNYLILNYDRFNKNFRHNFNDIVIKYDVDSLDMNSYVPSKSGNEYRLIANIVHDSINDQNDDSDQKQPGANKLFNANNHSWRIQLLDPLNEGWYEINNSQVKKINKRLIFLNESYIQVWQKKSVSYSFSTN